MPKMQWASVSVSLSQVVRDGIAAISARLGTAATQHEMFSKLCDYSRRTFTYHPSGTGLSSALSMNLFNCETISDLTYLLWLFRNPEESHDVAREGVHGGNKPVISVPLARPGIKIQNNIRNGNGRMLFSAGHFVARIGVHKLDVIGGISGVTLDPKYGVCQAVAGTNNFTCNIGGHVHTLTRIGQTANGLGEYVAMPTITT
jgi:hypothetical protein